MGGPGVTWETDAAQTRRATGAIYTPPLIARELVQRTLRSRLDAGQLDLRVLDPACGDGALLVEAFEAIVHARQARGASRALAARQTVATNLYGVDRGAEAAAACRAALAERARITTDEVHGVVCADTLLDPVLEELGGRGFDAIVGNPPYVRVQRLRAADPGWAARVTARYPRTCRGSYDLYLPFIERGLQLLAPNGVMGLVAPAAWLVLEHARGLRAVVAEGRHLHEWIDFGAHQVFADVTTYVALQFYTASPNTTVRIARAAGAGLGPLDYRRIPHPGAERPEAPWHLLGEPQRSLLDGLRRAHPTLLSRADIAVGVQTSADRFYHLTRLGPGRYRARDGREVALEDDLMRPVCMGRHVRAFETPSPPEWILLPYVLETGQLLPSAELQRRFPQAWGWLRQNEAALRARERGRMDRDEGWWGYNYPKNLRRIRRPKLLIPRLTTTLRAGLDATGAICQDNVDVGGVFPHDPDDLLWLLAVLNSPVADFAWRCTSRPFRGGFLGANKQFLAPLPVPVPTAALRAEGIALVRASAPRAAIDRVVTRAYGPAAVQAAAEGAFAASPSAAR